LRRHIYILAKFIQTTQLSKKLAEHYLGPFSMMEKVGTHSYLIKLPEHLRTIHPMFYISQLEPAPLSNIPNYSNPLLPSIKVDKDLKFEVAQILDSKWDQQRRDPLLYYIC